MSTVSRSMKNKRERGKEKIVKELSDDKVSRVDTHSDDFKPLKPKAKGDKKKMPGLKKISNKSYQASS